MKTLNSFNFRNKTVLVRIDINSHVNGRIQDNERFEAVKQTIMELKRKKAKIVLLAHQGHSKKEFIHLDQHAKILSKHVGKVQFVRDILGKKAEHAIINLRPGEVLLLDNVRLLDEQKRKGKINRLQYLADYYVNEAFSNSHRAHASMVGFKLKSCVGRYTERELKALKRATRSKGVNTFIFGGAKSDDMINIMKNLLGTRSMEYALVCGVTGNIFLKASGVAIGHGSEAIIRKNKLTKYVKVAKQLLKRHKRKIILPVDWVEKNNTILDIGPKTIKLFKKYIKKSNSVVVKGPAGMYEDARYRKGTKALFTVVTKSRAYTIAGGGDTDKALETLKIPPKKFSHVTLGGGAMITFLSGKPLPAIEAIRHRS